MRHASSLSQIVASERLPDSRLKLVVQGLGRVQCLRATRVTTREYVTYLQDNLASSSDPSRAPPRPLSRGARAPIHLGTTLSLVLIVAPVR